VKDLFFQISDFFFNQFKMNQEEQEIFFRKEYDHGREQQDKNRKVIFSEKKFQLEEKMIN
jgi:hypothetical protein